MAVPKKRTSKAKKNKRKTFWQLKAGTMMMRFKNINSYVEAKKWEKNKEVPLALGFKPELRYKRQPTDQLNSKKEHFMEDTVKTKLEQLVSQRLAFNPTSSQERNQETKNRIIYTTNSKIEKQKRVRNNKNRKAVAREKAAKEAGLN
uniref:Ribosomal protein L32 n=1 Tax=Blidingia minima TaxID=63414 RepID=A0A2Z4M9I2_9CHLO|nr:ribosomal protein L32 [Blidingia minima]QUX32864.1 50S ribosomal protein L32 [Blidingia minima]